MTTREQLGLNANWIPMDSSKSGGSDEFLVKKVNQLEEKVNGLELSGFKIPTINSDEDTSLHVGIAKENEKVIATLSLRFANETSKVKFLYNGKLYTVTPTNQVKFEVPEILDTKLAEYGIHCYHLNMILDDILISSIDRLAISSEFGNTLRATDSISSSSRKISLELNLKFLDYDRSKAKIISRTGESIRYDNQNRSVARSAIVLSPDTNTFIITDKSVGYTIGYTNIFLHPDYKPFVVNDGTNSGQEGKIVGSPKIKTLQVLDIGSTVVKDEVEFIWKPVDEALKDKLIPMIIGNNDNAARGIKGNYGYYGDKSSYPVVVFSPNQRNCITYAYKSDLSEWLGYFTESILGTFIKNAKSVPNYYSSEYLVPFSQRTDGYYSEKEFPYTYSVLKPKSRISDLGPNYFYAYPRNVFSDYNGDRTNFAGSWPPDYNIKIKDLTYRGHIGVTLRDFDDNKTVEVWTFSQLAINSNSVNELYVNSLSN